MLQGEIWWANLPAPSGWRPVVVLTRDDAIEHLHAVIVAPLTRTIRHIPTEVEVGPEQGLPTACAISLDNLGVVEKDRLTQRIAGSNAEVMNEIVEAIREVFGLPY